MSAVDHRQHGNSHGHGQQEADLAPGEEGHAEGHDVAGGIRGYVIGLVLAVLLTVASFTLGSAHWIYGPGLPIALIVLAIAQMGIHLVFFLHLTTSPDNINNAMALAFGVLIVFLVIGGSVWIMMDTNSRMMGMSSMSQMSH